MATLMLKNAALIECKPLAYYFQLLCFTNKPRDLFIAYFQIRNPTTSSTIAHNNLLAYIYFTQWKCGDATNCLFRSPAEKTRSTRFMQIGRPKTMAKKGRLTPDKWGAFMPAH